MQQMLRGRTERRQILFGVPPKGGPVGERDVTLW